MSDGAELRSAGQTKGRPTMYGGILFGSEFTAERGRRPEFDTVENGTSEDAIVIL